MLHSTPSVVNRRFSMDLSASDIIGSTGVGLILIAFLLNLAGVWDREAPPYLWLNLVGATLAGLASLLIPFYPFVLMEGVWALAALAGLVRLRARQPT
jgi:hypothetical protein